MADKKPSKPKAGAPTAITNTTSLDVDALRAIVELLEASEVSRLDWTNGDERLTIRRGPQSHVIHHAPVQHTQPAQQSTAVHVTSPSPSTAAKTPPSSAPRPTDKVEKKGQLITSPFVGTFYRTPAPDQPAFTEVGAQVKKGQVICIVEAMKLMNEIEAEFSGKVTEVLVANATAVEFGQPLFRIES